MAVETLFNLYAKNLHLHCPDVEDGFACFICRTGFLRNELDKLSLAHIIPKAIGGKTKTLLCKKCNHTIGYWYDSEAVKEVHTRRFPLGTEKEMKAKLQIQDTQIPTKACHNQNGFNINIQQNSPERLKHFKEIWTDQQVAGSTIKLEFEPINGKWRDFAYICSSMLAMFRTFGYEYVFHRCARSIREYLERGLNGKTTEQAPSIISRISFNSANLMKTDPDLLDNKRDYQIWLVTLRGMHCLGVYMPQLDHACVLLPGLDQNSAQSYLNLFTLNRDETEQMMAKRLSFKVNFASYEQGLCSMIWGNYISCDESM